MPQVAPRKKPARTESACRTLALFASHRGEKSRPGRLRKPLHSKNTTKLPLGESLHESGLHTNALSRRSRRLLSAPLHFTFGVSATARLLLSLPPTPSTRNYLLRRLLTRLFAHHERELPWFGSGPLTRLLPNRYGSSGPPYTPETP